MIVAMLIILLSGSDNSILQSLLDQMSERANIVVEDKVRRETLESMFEQAGDDTRTYEEKRADIHNEWLKLSEQDVSSPGDQQRVFDALEENNQAYEQAMIAHRMALREQLSRDEWKKMFPPN